MNVGAVPGDGDVNGKSMIMCVLVPAGWNTTNDGDGKGGGTTNSR